MCSHAQQWRLESQELVRACALAGPCGDCVIDGKEVAVAKGPDYVMPRALQAGSSLQRLTAPLSAFWPTHLPLLCNAQHALVNVAALPRVPHDAVRIRKRGDEVAACVCQEPVPGTV